MSAAVFIWLYLIAGLAVYLVDSRRGERPSLPFWSLMILANIWIVAWRLS